VQNTATKMTQGLKQMLDNEKRKDFVLFSLSERRWEGDAITLCKNFHLQTAPDRKGLSNQKGKDRTGINGCKPKPNQFK